MKKRTVKGFTLIELIVVMATFGIILFGAMNLIPHVSSIMVLADVREEGNAATSNIASYLKNQLSPVEYLNVKNYVVPGVQDGGNYKLSDTSVISEFVESYYEGVVRAGADPTTFAGNAAEYGDGIIHVLTIDNDASDSGKISHYQYKANFKVGDPNLTFVSSEEYAVNEAYYDNYEFYIKVGMYTENDMAAMPVDDRNKLLDSLTVNNTSFTIEASTNRRVSVGQDQTYSFVANSSMALINLYNRSDGAVPGLYYAINEKMEGTPAALVRTLVDVSQPISKKSDNALFTLSRTQGQILKGSWVEYKEPAVGTKGGYTFIYSYGEQIDTKKP